MSSANCRKGTSPKNPQYEFSPSWYSSVTEEYQNSQYEFSPSWYSSVTEEY
jgi:hypothetical protein